LPYVYFVLGFTVGACVESTGNIKNLCAADVASVVVSGYHIYYYMNEYSETSKELALAWSVTYMVKAFETWYNIQCPIIQEWKAGIETSIFGGDEEME